MSDYGATNFINNLNSRTSRGTPLTMAPEVLNGKELSNKSHIWSLGIIIYFLLFIEYILIIETLFTMIRFIKF